jgi:hypothetical protein
MYGFINKVRRPRSRRRTKSAAIYIYIYMHRSGGDCRGSRIGHSLSRCTLYCRRSPLHRRRSGPHQLRSSSVFASTPAAAAEPPPPPPPSRRRRRRPRAGVRTAGPSGRSYPLGSTRIDLDRPGSTRIDSDRLGTGSSRAGSRSTPPAQLKGGRLAEGEEEKEEAGDEGMMNRANLQCVCAQRGKEWEGGREGGRKGEREGE